MYPSNLTSGHSANDSSEHGTLECLLDYAAMTKERNNIVGVTCQSKPVDTTEPYDAAWIAGRTILITGGASGFGEGFFRKWAEHGACVIIGDVNKTRGSALVEEVRKTAGNPNLHFLYCDVANWQSQVDFFRSAVKLSPHGGIDAVVANAGISENNFDYFMNPKGLDVEEPPMYVLHTVTEPDLY
jgi:hypothetical protein